MNQNQNENKKGPICQTRIGRFQTSIWKWNNTRTPSGSLRDYTPEQERTVYRACLNYSTWSRATRQWRRSAIWCDLDEIRDLYHALEALNEKRIEQLAQTNVECVQR